MSKDHSTGKRLFRYGLKYKKTIIIALILLTIAVAAELTGPFIAKKLIDDHILGIEGIWYETTERDKAVHYNGDWFIRADRLPDDEATGAVWQILQVSLNYYMLEGELAFDGERQVDGNRLTVSFHEQQETYDVIPLTKSEVFSFYRPEVRYIVLLLSIYVGLLIFAAFFQYGQSYLLQVSANRIIQRMRNDVFQQVQRLPIDYFDRLPAGKIVSRITNDTEAIRELYIKVLSTFFNSFIYMGGIFIALFLLDVTLASISLILIPILIIWIIIYRKYAHVYNHVIRSKISEINAMINESIQGMRVIQVFRRQRKTEQEFEALNEEHFKYQNKMLSLNALTSHNLAHTLKNITFVVLIWYFGGASLGVGSIVSIGVLYAFVDYINRLFQPVTNIVNQLALLEQAMVAGQRVFQLLDEQGEDTVEGSCPRYKGHVTFDNVWFAYQGEDYVLKNISFEANQGETVALVGHTGSGKSSIMNLLFRFYDVSRGRITIDGVDIRQIPKQHLRQHMGIVLQDPFLFSGTIMSNVSLDDPRVTREKVIQALKDVGADQFIEALPLKYEQPVLEKGSTFSAGQRQLISFARALAFDPAILVLDEATANVDTETEGIIQRALDVLKKGRTTFIIAHRLSTIKNANLILVLDRGEIVEQGTHEELIKRKGKYYHMYQLQQGQSKLEKVI